MTADFKPEFRQKLQDFYKRFYFPAELKNLKNRCVCVCVCIQACFLSILLKEPFKRRLSWYLFDLCCRLSVRPWDDVLLVSVLKGQNVSGSRKEKGKKDVLVEQISVVLLRTEVLQQQKRYKQKIHSFTPINES